MVVFAAARSARCNHKLTARTMRREWPLRQIRKRIGWVAMGLALCAAVPACAAEVTLTLAHFLSPNGSTHRQFIAPWARRVEAQSGGRIRIEIFPAMALGGRPNELYRQVRDGAADIVWTLTGYTPGVFPRSEVFELIGVHQNSARATTLAIQDVFAQIAPDFAQVKPLLVHTHAGNALHLAGGCVRTIADLIGLKLRTPSRTGGWMISSWGAEPVGMPVPALPQALSKRAIDGALIPFQVVEPLRVQDMTRCSVTGPDDARFGTSVFLLAMNQARYNGLSPELKAVIDANSGANIAADVGAVWDGLEQPGKAAQRATGAPVTALSPQVYAAMKARAEPIIARWIKQVEAAGIDGDALVKAARAAIARRASQSNEPVR